MEGVEGDEGRVASARGRGIAFVERCLVVVVFSGCDNRPWTAWLASLLLEHLRLLRVPFAQTGNDVHLLEC